LLSVQSSSTQRAVEPVSTQQEPMDFGLINPIHYWCLVGGPPRFCRNHQKMTLQNVAHSSVSFLDWLAKITTSECYDIATCESNEAHLCRLSSSNCARCGAEGPNLSAVVCVVSTGHPCRSTAARATGAFHTEPRRRTEGVAHTGFERI
jgi:hypothetical protein